MPVRASAIAAFAVSAMLSWSIPAFSGDAPPPPIAAPIDSAAAPSGPLANARAAYQAAWAQRHSGDPASAVQTADVALAEIQGALAANPDAATQRELVDLQAKLSGLRDASSADVRNSPPEPGNEADDTVLNAPAIDALQPQLNADVYKWIEFFSGAGRSTFERWLKRSGRYMTLFRSVLQREGLPPDLVHLVFVESGFNLTARSVSAAVGPWQFLRGTAQLFGLTVDQWMDERRDPEKSTVAAARYLKHLYSIFGDWPLALASYNAGEGTVLRAIKAQGTTNYWDLRLPRQTEDYVPQFMAILAISREPEKYGFDAVELDDPMAFDEIAFKGAVDLRMVAKLADCSYDELRELNPAVLRGAAKGRDGVTTIRVPASKGEALLQKLQSGADLPAVNLTLKHTVKRGETLRGIAGKYGVNATALARENGVGKKRPLRRGMVLTVPASLKAPAPTLLAADDPRGSTAYVPDRRIGVPASLSGRSTADGRITITVRKGETLALIAEREGVSASDVMRWNHLHTARVSRGQRLKLRATDVGATTVDAAKDSVAAAAEQEQIANLRVRPARRGAHGSSRRGASHTGMIVVHRGETLASIARRHGVSVAQLRQSSGITTTRIRPGQKLRLPTS